jgi:hypothetical protein
MRLAGVDGAADDAERGAVAGVASAPALQCVRIVASAGTSVAPKAPSALQLATSSSWISCASATSAVLMSATDAPACASAREAPLHPLDGPEQVDAVGRVAAITSHDLRNSVEELAVPVAVLFLTPRARPIAADTPIAGAPRMTMVLIALATSLASCSGRRFPCRQLALVDHHDRVVLPFNRRKHIRTIVPGRAAEWSAVEQAAVEGVRKQGRQAVPGGHGGFVGQQHLEVAAELPRAMAAGAAGGVGDSVPATTTTRVNVGGPPTGP